MNYNSTVSEIIGLKRVGRLFYIINERIRKKKVSTGFAEEPVLTFSI